MYVIDGGLEGTVMLRTIKLFARVVAHSLLGKIKASDNPHLPVLWLLRLC